MNIATVKRLNTSAIPELANPNTEPSTSSNQLVVYGLRTATSPGADGGAPDTAADAGAPQGTDASGPAPTWTQLYTQFFGPGTPGHCSGTGGCHTNLRGGFKCGTNKNDCFAGLVAAGLVTPAAPAESPIAVAGESPLAWFGGGMPIDDPQPTPAAAAAVKAWVDAGAQNN